MSKEYQSREFCKAIKCKTQVNLEQCEKANPTPREQYGGKSWRDLLVENTKDFCSRTCMAWKFHEWLKKEGYKITR